MSQLSQLTDFVKSHLPDRVDEFDSWMDNQKITRSEKGLGKGQRRLGVTTYDGVLEFDKFPYRQCDPALLFGLVLIWLVEGANDLRDEMRLDDPDVEVELYDEESALVMITVPLVDEIVIAPDENGAIPMDGQRWDIVDPIFDVAESAAIFGADDTGAGVDDAGTS